jgi:hypothetical protein
MSVLALSKAGTFSLFSFWLCLDVSEWIGIVIMFMASCGTFA